MAPLSKQQNQLVILLLIGYTVLVRISYLRSTARLLEIGHVGRTNPVHIEELWETWREQRNLQIVLSYLRMIKEQIEFILWSLWMLVRFKESV